MNLQRTAIAVALVAGSLSAHAVTYNIGTLPLAPLVYTLTPSVPVGAFTDIYNFLFPATGLTASGTAQSVNITGLLNISNVQVSLFRTTPNTFVGAGGVGSDSQLFNTPLIPGVAYYYQVTGTATGAAGGVYNFLATAAPIPEPETYTLMAAGLGVIGFLAMRRRRQG